MWILLRNKPTRICRALLPHLLPEPVGFLQPCQLLGHGPPGHAAHLGQLVSVPTVLPVPVLVWFVLIHHSIPPSVPLLQPDSFLEHGPPVPQYLIRKKLGLELTRKERHQELDEAV